MTIDKAIEYLDIVLKAHPRLRPGDFGLAVQLGKEALKRVQLHRKDHFSSYPTLLPGETKD
ncbi:hypothetical protein ES705_39009 [subsurface metagenome]|jgi:hypothetical protein